MHKPLPSLASLAGILLFLGLAIPVRADSASDPSPFDIPVVPVPEESGFGATLEDACGAIISKPLVIPKPEGSTPLREALQTTPRASDNLQTLVSRLSDICAAIVANRASDTNLNDLREFQESGVMPDLAKALTAQGTLFDIKSLADSMQGPTGTLAGNLSLAPSLSGFEGQVLDGLANFLVTRSKQEAILYFQDQFKEQICTKDGSRLLPNLCATIQGLDPSMSIAAIGSALNAAARRDLVVLPDGLLQLMEEADTAHFYVPEVLRLFYAVAQEVVEGRVPKEVLLSMHALPLRQCEQVASPPSGDPNQRCQLAFSIPRLSSALLFAASWNKLEQVVKAPATHRPKIIGALLDAELRYSKPFGSAGIEDGAARKIQFSAKQINALGKILVAAGEILGRWQKPTNALTNAADAKSTASDRKRLLATTLFDALTSTNQLAQQVLAIVVPDKDEEFSKMLALVRGTAVLGRDLVNEAYSSIPLDAGKLLTDVQSVLPEGKPKSDTATVKRFISIVVEIASAQSSADVTAVLEAAAAPADSYRAKYQRPQVALNALVGGLVSWERLNKPSDPALGDTKNSMTFAGFAPVGVEGTLPLCSRFYLGAMLSVLDIGAMTTTRFKSEVSSEKNVTSTTNVSFAQVFSPGAYVLVGLNKSPFVIGGGISYAPSLRSLEATSNGSVIANEKVSSLRIGGFLAIDVSIFSL